MKNNKRDTGKSEFQYGMNELKSVVYHLPRNERYEKGKQLRETCPRTSHAIWKAAAKRPGAIELLLESEKKRMPKLLPLRHGRMAQSPFTFYRGSAWNMAYDLYSTPVSGIIVQACGDAHLCNFGGFATPERNVIFSINDLDETLPAPWEWDLKRLATSFVVACRNNNISEAAAEEAVMNCVSAYRKNMAQFSEMKTMELWHYSLGADMMLGKIKDADLKARAEKRVAKEKGRSIAEDIFPQLVKASAQSVYIKDELPAIFHWEGYSPGQIIKQVQDAFDLYRKSLPPVYAFLLNRYQIKDLAIKVVGVGSVGTYCWVFLLTTGDGEPLFLQAKEARASVLEPYAGKSIYANHGERVINGYRLMQPFSDPFLGWTEGREGRQFFFRQLRDIKISVKVEAFAKTDMLEYADWCGQALALSHARSGDAAMLNGYLGKSDQLDEALAKFSFTYANQNEKDFAALKRAIRTGKLEAQFEE